MALGLTGRKIGETLSFLLEQVVDGELPNQRERLLEAAGMAELWKICKIMTGWKPLLSALPGNGMLFF